MNLSLYTLFSQIIFALWFFIIHFIPLPPLNDIDKFPNAPSWKRTLFIHWCILLLLTLAYTFGNIYLQFMYIAFLSLFVVGHITTWWLPYLFGWPKTFIDNVQIDHKCTLRFLPDRTNRPVPDVAYCILGLTGMSALLLSVIALV